MKAIKLIVLLVVTAISPILFVRQAVKLSAEKAENAKNIATVKADTTIITRLDEEIRAQQEVIDSLIRKSKGTIGKSAVVYKRPALQSNRITNEPNDKEIAVEDSLFKEFEIVTEGVRQLSDRVRNALHQSPANNSAHETISSDKAELLRFSNSATRLMNKLKDRPNPFYKSEARKTDSLIKSTYAQLNSLDKKQQ